MLDVSFLLSLQNGNFDSGASTLKNNQLLKKKLIPELTFTFPKSIIETKEKRCEVFSKLTIKTPERRRWSFFLEKVNG